MNRTILTIAAAAIAFPALAAPRLVEKPKTPISHSNAAKLVPIGAIEQQVYRIVPLRKHGELAFVSWEGPISVVKDADLTPSRTIGEKERYIAYSSTRDGAYFATTRNGTGIQLHNSAKGTLIGIPTENSQPSTAFSVDGKILATGGYGSHVSLWDLSGKKIRDLDCGGKGGLWPVFSPDSKTLAVGNRNDSTSLFDVASGKLLHTLQKRMTQELAFSPDGSKLAIGYVDGSLSIWDVAKGEELHSKKSGGTEVYTLDWSPKGDLLVTAGLAGKIILWDPRQLEIVKELDAPDWVICAKFTLDGSRLLTSGAKEGSGKVDRKVTVWGLSGEDK